jgi:3-dehydroquinate synthase
MKKLRVNLGKRGYNILIGNGVLNSLGKALRDLDIGNDACLVTNPAIKKLYGKRLAYLLKQDGFDYKFIEVPDSEKSKSYKGFINLINHISAWDRHRRVFITAFGGGVVGDLSGFAAAVYKRGVPLVQIPTTLLAQVDSSIGGKVAIDLDCGKNLIGAFYQPKLVLSDIGLLTSLPLAQLCCGLAEVVKYGVISNSSLFEFLEKKWDKVLNFDMPALEHIIEQSSLIKARLIEQDERDALGIRMILNFGHTVGHALEAAGKYKTYNHGEAVALGMLVACEIANILGIFPLQELLRLENLISRLKLPTKIKGAKLNDILEAQLHDKKFIGKKNRFVLPERIGKVRICEDIPMTIVKRAIRKRSIN